MLYWLSSGEGRDGWNLFLCALDGRGGGCLPRGKRNSGQLVNELAGVDSAPRRLSGLFVGDSVKMKNLGALRLKWVVLILFFFCRALGLGGRKNSQSGAFLRRPPKRFGWARQFLAGISRWVYHG